MYRNFKSTINFGDEGEENDDEHFVTLDNFDPSRHEVLSVPWTVKLITPHLLQHFPQVIEFVRYDLKNYPRVVHVDKAPTPFPTLEAYNMEGRLLHDIDISYKSRSQINRLMERFEQTPTGSLQWLTRPEFNAFDPPNPASFSQPATFSRASSSTGQE